MSVLSSCARSVAFLAFLAFLALTLFAGAACRSDKTDSSVKTSGEHGAANAVPGSHEDWCGEHQVPESQCTRCNASLIPAFKATNDWCVEHDRPESQCLICHPTLKIERPAKTTGT